MLKGAPVASPSLKIQIRVLNVDAIVRLPIHIMQVISSVE